MKRFLTTMVVITIFTISCKKEKKPPTAPSVTTAALTNVTTTGATGGGTITSDGGSAITGSGIVLSRAHATPTLTDTVITSTVTSGSFTSNITNLDFGRTYYIRAYATNAIGTSYGDVVTLNTTNDDTKVRFTYNGQEVIYGVITSSVTGKKWMDRNLGATAMATSLTDAAGYGHLFQWGRLADGHQLRNSGYTQTLSTTDVPGNSNFIANPSGSYDWRNPQNNNLWQGSTGTNNPCPSGWHVPVIAEWQAENMTSASIAFAQLKLPYAGFRWTGDAMVHYDGTEGDYWSSTSAGGNPYANSMYFYFPAGGAGPYAGYQRANALAVRCIHD